MSILLVTGHWSLATLFVGVPLALSLLGKFTLFVLACVLCFLAGLSLGIFFEGRVAKRRNQGPVQTLFQTLTPPSKTDDDSYYG